MTDPADPSRLVDSDSEAAGLRAALRSAHADVGSDDQVARLAKRLGPLLAIGATGAAVTTAASSGVVKGAATSVAAKVGAAALALIAAGGGVWLVNASPAKPPPAPTEPAIAHAALPAPPVPSPPAPAADPPSPSPVASPAAGPPPAQKKAVSNRPVPATELGEGELLEQARTALRGDPATALSKANEARSRFPRSALAQEREVIAIQALRKLGRSAEADQRSSAFSKAFPDSPFQRKLDATP